jgi:hypothetical protein
MLAHPKPNRSVRQHTRAHTHTHTHTAFTNLYRSTLADSRAEAVLLIISGAMYLPAGTAGGGGKYCWSHTVVTAFFVDGAPCGCLPPTKETGFKVQCAIWATNNKEAPSGAID